MKVIHVVLFFIGVLCGIFFVHEYKRAGLVPLSQRMRVERNTDTFSVETPPKKSIKGEVVRHKGEVLWESRTATAAAQILSQEFIQQGEALKTDDESSIEVHFPELGTVELLPESEVSFVQTLPYSLVLNQKSGTIMYERLGDSPVSIRALHMLVTIDEGSDLVELNKDDSTISVIINNGSARVAYNDLDYVSTVTALSEGDEFMYDDETREGSVE